MIVKMRRCEPFTTLEFLQILLNTDMERFSKFQHRIQRQKEQIGYVKKAFNVSPINQTSWRCYQKGSYKDTD